MTDLADYFSSRELRDPESHIVRLHEFFAPHLLELRVAYKRPMIVNSACRSATYNTEIGGHPRSLHVYDRPHRDGSLGTLAIDIHRPASSEDIRELVAAALSHNWSVGVAKTFFHLDRRDLVGLPSTVFGY